MFEGPGQDCVYELDGTGRHASEEIGLKSLNVGGTELDEREVAYGRDNVLLDDGPVTLHCALSFVGETASRIQRSSQSRIKMRSSGSSIPRSRVDSSLRSSRRAWALVPRTVRKRLRRLPNPSRPKSTVSSQEPGLRCRI